MLGFTNTSQYMRDSHAADCNHRRARRKIGLNNMNKVSDSVPDTVDIAGRIHGNASWYPSEDMGGQR